MVFRFFYRIIYGYVFNEKTIDRLADSYPIRMAARLVSRGIIRGQKTIENNMKNVNQEEVVNKLKNLASDNKLSRVAHRFAQELKTEANNAREEMRRRQR